VVNRTLIVKGKITKMYLDERYNTGKSLAVISYADPCYDQDRPERSHIPARKMVVPGAGFEIGQDVVINIETIEESKCQWCGAHKDNSLGMCTKCHRFPEL
jgi:hypothetical protein